MLQWIEKVYQQVQNYRPPTHLIRGYAQGVALCDYLIFLSYLSWNEWLKCCMAISPVTLFLPSSAKYAH